MKFMHQMKLWHLTLAFAGSALANPIVPAGKMVSSLLQIGGGRALLTRVLGGAATELTGSTKAQTALERFLERQTPEVGDQITRAIQAIESGNQGEGSDFLASALVNALWGRAESPAYANKGLLGRMGQQPLDTQNLIHIIVTSPNSEPDILIDLLRVAKNHVFTPESLHYLLDRMPRASDVGGAWDNAIRLYYGEVVDEMSHNLGRGELVAEKIHAFIRNSSSRFSVPFEAEIIYHALRNTEVPASSRETYQQALGKIEAIVKDSLFWQSGSYGVALLEGALGTLITTHTMSL